MNDFINPEIVRQAEILDRMELSRSINNFNVAKAQQEQNSNYTPGPYSGLETQDDVDAYIKSLKQDVKNDYLQNHVLNLNKANELRTLIILEGDRQIQATEELAEKHFQPYFEGKILPPIYKSPIDFFNLLKNQDKNL